MEKKICFSSLTSLELDVCWPKHFIIQSFHWNKIQFRSNFQIEWLSVFRAKIVWEISQKCFKNVQQFELYHSEIMLVSFKWWICLKHSGCSGKDFLRDHRMTFFPKTESRWKLILDISSVLLWVQPFNYFPSAFLQIADVLAKLNPAVALTPVIIMFLSLQFKMFIRLILSY